MKVGEIVELLKQGRKPLVRLKGALWEDGWGEAGMLARVMSHDFEAHWQWMAGWADQGMKRVKAKMENAKADRPAKAGERQGIVKQRLAALWAVWRMVGLVVERIRHPGAVICFNCGRTFAPRFAWLKARAHECKPNAGIERPMKPQEGRLT